MGFAFGPLLILLALLVSSEFPRLLDGIWFPAVALGFSVLSYGTASLVARSHMKPR